MTEDELKRLKDLPTPPPSAEAKNAALTAALAAFDSAAPGDAEKVARRPQEFALRARLTPAANAKEKEGMRTTPTLYRIAAGLAVLVVTAPLALYLLEGRVPSGEQPLTAPTPPQPPVPEVKPTAEIATAPMPPQPTVPEKKPAQEIAVAPPQSAAPEQSTVQQDKDRNQPAAPPPPVAEPAKPAEREFTWQQREAVTTEESRKSKADGGASAPAPAPRAVSRDRADKSAAPYASRRAEAPEMRTAPGQPSTGLLPPPPGDSMPMPAPELNRDQFETVAPNPVKHVATEPVSTFSIDVDTASYAFARRALNAGRLPPKDAVRVEEMINYFPYDYPRPDSAETPFRPTVTVVPAPWNPANRLVHIGIKGYELTDAVRPRANLVLLVDVSGSMRPDDRLPLVKNALRLLVDTLKPADTVGIVTYASGSGIALEPTKVSDKAKILAAIDALNAGGSTAGAQGIADAYRLAEAHFDKAAVNRVILATDGDFNVGITNREELKGYVERKRQAGIFLSILGVGAGNYNDALMQKLAQNGNGAAAYADTLNEARKVLVEEASSTLFPIAKDVKIQIEFNPALVSEYRLIGYETRSLRREDFNNDKVDAGEIGSGHTVTAIYEVTPAGAAGSVDALRYGRQETPAAPLSAPPSGELAFLKLRYKLPSEDVSKLISLPVTPAMEKRTIAEAPEDVRFSVAVAAYGQLLREQPYLKGYGYDDVLALAQSARGADPYGYRAEFLNLVRLAKSARP